MKRAMVQRFIAVLSLALVVFGMISYVVSGNRLLDNTIVNMRQVIGSIDYALDYNEDINSQVKEIQKALKGDLRITILKNDGIVVADTDATDIEKLDNHSDRDEIQQALKSGFGYATRYSDTLSEKMLYVAQQTQNGAYIVRVSIEYQGLTDYLKILLPPLLIAIIFVFAAAMLVAGRFSYTVTKPLGEIAEEMVHIRSEEPEFDFKTYQYEELNIISYTTDQLINEIKENMDRLDFEKKVRQEFFSNASHELKTPITSIKGYTELLQNNLANSEETKKDCIQRIIRETDHMTNLINDILMISKLETKDLSVDISEVRIAPLLAEVLESLQPIAIHNEVTLHQDCQPIVMQDSVDQLRELLSNLIMNAIKYNRPGGDVWVTIFKQSSEMTITVKDNGIGISEEDKARVFERFYCVDKGRSKKSGGTGLGLSIVKHIVSYHNGTLELESELGRGSTFTIRIPMQNENVV